MNFSFDGLKQGLVNAGEYLNDAATKFSPAYADRRFQTGDMYTRQAMMDKGYTPKLIQYSNSRAVVPTAPTFKQNAISGLNALKAGARNVGNMPIKAVVGNPIVDTLLLAGPAIYSKNMENTARMSKEYEPEFWRDWGEYSRKEMSNGAEQDDLMPIEDYREQWLANRPKELEQRQDNLANVAHAMYEEENAVPAPAVLPTPTVEATPLKTQIKTKTPVKVSGSSARTSSNPELDLKNKDNNSLSWLNDLLPLLLAGGIGYYAGK